MSCSAMQVVSIADVFSLNSRVADWLIYQTTYMPDDHVRLHWDQLSNTLTQQLVLPGDLLGGRGQQ